MARPLRVFISYSRRDEEYLRELRAHAGILIRQGLLAPWSDQDVLPGSEFEKDIWAALGSADLVLVLLSADSLASEWCAAEMQAALDLHRRGDVRVIPVLVRACSWELSPLAKLSMLPRNGQPVSQWRSRDDAWTSVLEDLRRLMK